MGNVMGQLNIRVDEELKEAFIKKAKEHNTSATELLIEYMKQYLATPQKKESQKIEELERRLVRVEQVLGELAA
jgi:oligoribonuclease NrnB/cAMP/cGMP phosphodiesterase (DHH superfamily)